MVAVAIHRIAVVLHQTSGDNHRDITSWFKVPTEAQRKDRGLPRWIRDPKPPETLFYHSEYKNKGAYPDGISDVVGYWAENRILGGVVLFGRGQSGFGVSAL